jgi:hypothetical protein
VTSTNTSTGYWQEVTAAGAIVETCDPGHTLDNDANITRCTLADESYTLTNTDGTITACNAPITSTDATNGTIFCSITAGTTKGQSYTWEDNTEQVKVEECAAVNTTTTDATYNQIVCTTDTTG